MHKHRAMVFLVLLLALLLPFNLLGCSSKNSASKPDQTQNTTPKSSQQSNLKAFTRAELSKYDGQNGNKAYVAVDGKVYDVTNVGTWHNGQHQSHKAGIDLTNVMKNSPHGTRILKGMPVVGNLTD